MNSFSLANSLLVSVRIYRALLVAYPKTFREDYEIQMVQVFRDSFREAYHCNGVPGAIDLWLHTFADLLVTALIERISEGSQYMFSPKVILWGGLASLFGGLFWILAGLSNSPAALVLALVLGLGGLVGLYSRQAGQGGKLGLAGFALGIIGTVLPLAVLWWAFTSGLVANMKRDPASAAPWALIFPLALVISGIGLTLLGVASWRAKTPHGWRGLPLGLGLLSIIYSLTIWLVSIVPLSQGRLPWDTWNFGFFVLYPAVNVLLGLGWMGLGLMLTTEADPQGTQSPPASA
jgi:hypothetical protein